MNTNGVPIEEGGGELERDSDEQSYEHQCTSRGELSGSF